MRRLRKRLLEAYLENEEFQAGVNDMAERSGMKANDFILSADREGLEVLLEHLKVLEGNVSQL